jgi:hypothetical protein
MNLLVNLSKIIGFSQQVFAQPTAKTWPLQGHLSLEQALQHARGERHDLRTTVLPAPPMPMKKH